MEHYTFINDLINNLGFPIAMVCYFIWDKNTSTKKLIKVVENNNKILSKLLVRLGYEDLCESEVDEVV